MAVQRGQQQQKRAAKLSGSCIVIYGHDISSLNDVSAPDTLSAAGVQQSFMDVGLAEPGRPLGTWKATWLSPCAAAATAAASRAPRGASVPHMVQGCRSMQPR
jgi:hypothetical protein